MEIVFVWAVLSSLVGMLANSRGRSGFGYALLSFVLSPLIGLIVVLVTKNLIEEGERERRNAAEKRAEHERQIESIKVLAAAPAKVIPPAAAVTRSSIADELSKLAALRDQGILTPQEFQEQKAVILGQSSVHTR